MGNFDASLISQTLGNAAKSIGSSARSVWDNVSGGLTDAWNWAKGAADKVGHFFTADIPSFFAKGAGESIGSGVESGISPIISGFDALFKDLIDKANNPETFIAPDTGEGVDGGDESGSARKRAEDNLGFLNQLVGSLSGENQRILQELQREAAQEQYKFSKEMSSTAYQRAVTDMRKAGLNPAVMFAGNGASAASTPQVGIASVASENQLLSNFNSAAQLLSALGSLLKGVGEIIPL